MYICQKCGTNIATKNHFGTNYDNSINSDFCSDCYKNGSFVAVAEDYNDTPSFAGAFFLGNMGTDYHSGIGVPIGAPYLFDIAEDESNSGHL